MRILHQHPPRIGLNAMNHPRRIPQQHDVSAIAFDREVFINRYHDRPSG